MEPIEIADLDDPRLAPYRMVRERDLAGRQGLFIAEGKVVLDALLRHGRYPLLSVLVAGPRRTGLTGLLSRVPGEVPIYVVPQQAMERLTGFPIHRGLLAAGQRLPLPSAAGLLAALPPGPATVLVLEGLTNHDNTGACFRNAAAFGVQALLLDPTCCDPLYRKSIRVSAGQALALPYSQGDPLAVMLAALRDHGFSLVALTLAPSAKKLTPGFPRPAPRLALILGSEGPGLSAAACAAADVQLTIPMAPGVDSLNVATAAAVALFALQGGAAR